jgi:hypothetical protein
VVLPATLVESQKRHGCHQGVDISRGRIEQMRHEPCQREDRKGDHPIGRHNTGNAADPEFTAVKGARPAHDHRHDKTGDDKKQINTGGADMVDPLRIEPPGLLRQCRYMVINNRKRCRRAQILNGIQGLRGGV